MQAFLAIISLFLMAMAFRYLNVPKAAPRGAPVLINTIVDPVDRIISSVETINLDGYADRIAPYVNEPISDIERDAVLAGILIALSQIVPGTNPEFDQLLAEMQAVRDAPSGGAGTGYTGRRPTP